MARRIQSKVPFKKGRKQSDQGAPNAQPPVNDIERANAVKFTSANPRQRLHAKSLSDNQLTIVLGPAGAGKTYVSMIELADGILKGRYRRAVLMRPAVALEGEEHGFLPGDLLEKVSPWARPMIRKLGSMIGRGRLDAMLASGQIEVCPFTYLRGDEFESGTFVMLDEAQNCTVGQLRAFTTRIADGSTIVIAGDVSQTDLDEGSGLDVLAGVVDDAGIRVGIIEYKIEDIQRGDLCRAFVKAWEDYDDAM